MFKPAIYASRRKALLKNMSSGIVLIPGNEDAPMNYKANTYHFRQDSSFLYFFGLDQQGLAGLIDVDENRSLLFGDDADLDDIIWMGPRPSIRSLGERSGIDQCHPFRELEKFLKQASAKGEKSIIFLHTEQKGYC
jgi:Xaa-Pro aminopeptidase